MAKYDTFVVSENYNISGKQGVVALTVLFEDGDNTASAMLAAQVSVDSHVASEVLASQGKPTVGGALKYLNELTKEQVRDLCRQYWTKQMKALGTGKTVYGNELRADIITAQNSSN